MLNIVLSAVAYFIAYYALKRTFDDMDLPRGMTRSLLTFSLATAFAYGIAALVDRLVT